MSYGNFMIYIKNTSGSSETIRGNTISNNGYYLIPLVEVGDWASDTNVFTLIASGNAQIARDDSGTGDIIEVTEQWKYLTRIVPEVIDVGLGTLVGPQGDQGAQGEQGIQGVQGVAGGLTSYTYNESEAQSTTTSNSYQQKLKLTTPSLASGNYLIQWYCEITSTDKDGVACIVELDDATTIAEIKDDRHHSEDYFKPFSGLKQVTLSSGVHEIDIDYKRLDGTAKIRRARISIMGVN
jgi:hypothetical protein